MKTEKISKETWRSFFDELSKKEPPTLVKFEFFDPEMGDQTELSWVRLEGISYDPKHKSLEIMTEAATHRISGPNEIFVGRENGVVRYVEVTDEANHKQLVELKAA